MIVPFLTFGFALALVLANQNVIAGRSKFILAIVVVSLSAIPLVLQFVLLLGELAWARKYWMKLLLHLTMINILGSYGPASPLVFREYRQKKFGAYGNAKGRLWRSILYIGHGLATVLGTLTFRDAFSGTFTVRHTSVALWIEKECKEWNGPKKPGTSKGDGTSEEEAKYRVDKVNELYLKPHVKDVRDLTLTVEFSRIEGAQWETVVPIEPTEKEQAPNGAGSSPTDQQQPPGDEDEEPHTIPVPSPAAQGERSGAGSSPLDHQQRPGDEELQTMAVSSPAGLGNQMGVEPSPKNVTYHVAATGSRDGLLSKLYRKDWKDRTCSEGALEFFLLMETLNNDTFVVEEAPPKENDLILSCANLEDIVNGILRHDQKLNARRVIGMSYV